MATRLTLEEIAKVKKNISSDAYQKKLRENFPSLTVHSHIEPTVHSIAATEAPSTSAAAGGGGVRPFNPYGSYPAMPTVSLPPLSTGTQVQSNAQFRAEVAAQKAKNKEEAKMMENGSNRKRTSRKRRNMRKSRKQRRH